jgi:hypothetical protein
LSRGKILCLPIFSFFAIFKKEEKMGTRVKPVQPTEIRDKKIVYQVIQEIRRKPTAAALRRHKEEDDDLIKLLKK